MLKELNIVQEEQYFFTEKLGSSGRVITRYLD